MKRLFLFITTSLLIVSCGENNNSTNDKTISGNISDLAEGTQIYLDYLMPTQLVTKDTATIDAEGNYSFDYKIESIGYYRLRINNQNFINLILDVNENPTINGNGTNLMDTYTVEGSKESQDLKQFNIVMKKDYLFQDSLNQLFQANQNNPQIAIEIQQKSIAAKNKLTQYFQKIVNNSPSSLLSLAAVQQLNPDEYIEVYKKVDAALSKKIPNNPHYISFHSKVENLSKMAIGSTAPDFSVTGKNGNPISLADFKGKVVLVDFWASWCRPCRAENPNVVKAYKKYNSKGFEVFNVSLDGMPQQQNPKQDWLAAIEKDGLIWDGHGSELKGWQSSFVPTYGIEGIPFTILLDTEGKIIGKNLRGAALESKLEEIFQ
jgi:thiol-disulfide isomerase/thioredoxin